MGFSLCEAVNGQEALHKVLEFKPSLILMDLRMPVMDGLEATRRIRQLSLQKKVVIIAASASAFGHNQQKSRDVGCDDFLAKPFRLERLLEMLANHLKISWIYSDEEVKEDS